MPKIGEIRQTGNNASRWIPCESCGKARWTGVSHDYRVLYKLCNVCSRKEYNSNHKSKYRYMDKRGYVIVVIKRNNPYFSMCHSSKERKNGLIYEHRLVMAAHLGRVLLHTEVVHHINGIKDDNRIENLQLMSPNNHHFDDVILKKEIKRLQEENRKLVKRIIELESQP